MKGDEGEADVQSWPMAVQQEGPANKRELPSEKVLRTSIPVAIKLGVLLFDSEFFAHGLFWRGWLTANTVPY